MEAYAVFKDLAIIIVAAKFLAIIARKCKAHRSLERLSQV